MRTMRAIIIDFAIKTGRLETGWNAERLEHGLDRMQAGTLVGV